MELEQDNIREWIRLGVYVGVAAYMVTAPFVNDEDFARRYYFYVAKILNKLTCWARNTELKYWDKYHAECEW